MELAPVALQRKRQKSCIDSIRVGVIARLALFRGVHRGPGSRAEGSADAGRQQVNPLEDLAEVQTNNGSCQGEDADPVLESSRDFPSHALAIRSGRREPHSLPRTASTKTG